ncbi:MAG: BTAD domain-containing putative transcriptional regulator [Anaerolineaceae bacterium]
MPLSDMVIRSKLIPPQAQRAIFQRPRLREKLSQSTSYPLTVVHAGTGFGKTTALIELGSHYPRVFWYDISEPDRDPTVFISHLVSALLPNPKPLLDRLEQNGLSGANSIITSVINQLTTDLEEDAVLILDDVHHIIKMPEIEKWIEELVDHQPPHLNIALSSRQVPETPAFVRWRVKGNVLMIDQTDLSFNQEEIQQLFSVHHQYPISDEEAAALFSYTGGWIIALEMIWQRIQASHSRKLEKILNALPSVLTDLFTFLAQEVLMRQPEPVQQFLVQGSILRQMDAAKCNALLDINNSEEILEQLVAMGLFISTADNLHYHYQRLFQDFLQAQAARTPDLVRSLHEKAARLFLAAGDNEEAIFHYLCGEDHPAAARLIESVGRRMLDQGRLTTLAAWIDQIPLRERENYPSLFLLQGDVLRLMSNFEDALNSYNRADRLYVMRKDPHGRSKALRGKAQVYLDTIRPLKASSLLEEAVVLLEPQEFPAEVAELLDALAENKLNLGKPQEAFALHQEASLLHTESETDSIYLEARSLLRTGRLHEGVSLLESSGLLDDETRKARPQRFHREMSLLLSLIHLMLGHARRGELFASKGIELGRQLDSPFVEAVGWMRLGHAAQIHAQVPWRAARTQKAVEYYQRAIELVRPFNVMRVHVEPLWGLSRYYGYQGNLPQARLYADQAIEIAESSGDHWFVALLYTTMGTSYALAGRAAEADEWLSKGRAGFTTVADLFGQATTDCAAMLNQWLNGSHQMAIEQLQKVAPVLQSGNYGFLFTRPSMLGVQNPQAFLPLLIESQHQGLENAWIQQFLRENGLEGVDFHPGYGLQVRTLGPFEVRRGTTPVAAHDWQREKARQVFQFLITNRGKWFTREQLSDRLWPQLDSEGSAQNIKVVLNALNHALDPARDTGRSPFFVARRETLYGLNPAAQICVDADDFLELSASPQEEDWAEALSFYQADYLDECLDEPWCVDYRNRLRDVYLTTSQRYLKACLLKEHWDLAIKVSHDVLELDTTNEFAYQVLMQCHAARGNRSTVNAVYQRCVTALRADLDVEPSPETTRLWQQLTK